MKQRLTSVALTALMVALMMVVLVVPSPVVADGATQIAGIAYYAATGEGTDAAGQGADFTLRMTGDLEGCHYIFIETAECSPSGIYHESGTETFVGRYNGQTGTFRTSYHASAKFADCAHLAGEIFGRCEHPIIADSGMGGFKGVTGRLDFKDDVAAGNFPYRGHLRW